MTQDQDARLVALIDGALPAGEADALRAELAREPALATRLEALDVDLTGLSTEMEEHMPEAPPVPSVALPLGSFERAAIAASIALALLLGGMWIGNRMGPERFTDWRDYAAAYHLLYQPETLAAPLEGDGGVARVSAALGQDLSPLAEVEGLDFRRAQILGWNGETLIQFAYLDASGRPVAVCVMAFDIGPPGLSLSSEDRQGLATTTFHSGGLQLLVIGPDGGADTEALGERIAAQL